MNPMRPVIASEAWQSHRETMIILTNLTLFNSAWYTILTPCFYYKFLFYTKKLHDSFVKKHIHLCSYSLGTPLAHVGSVRFKIAIIAFLSILTFSLPSLAENTYNFYFDTEKETTSPSDEGKEKEEIKTEPAEKEEPEKTTLETLEQSISQSIPPTPSVDRRRIFKSFFTNNDKYLSVGGGFESYFNGTQASVIAKTKFLPYLGFEFAMPALMWGINDSKLNHIYRFNTLLETTFFKFLNLHLKTGALFYSVPFGGYPKPFVGVGLNLRVFRFLDLSASVNSLIGNFENTNLNTHIHAKGAPFYSVGASINLLALN